MKLGSIPCVTRAFVESTFMLPPLLPPVPQFTPALLPFPWVECGPSRTEQVINSPEFINMQKPQRQCSFIRHISQMRSPRAQRLSFQVCLEGRDRKGLYHVVRMWVAPTP